MSRIKENEKEFKRQSYLRLLSYAKPYWFRLTIGVVAGFMVGGSMFASLMVLPDLMNAVEYSVGGGPSRTVSKQAAKIAAAIENQDGRELTKEEKEKAIAEVLSPADSDPKLTQSMDKLEHYAQKLHLPISVENKRKVNISWPVNYTFSVIDSAGRMAWQFFLIYVIAFVIGWTIKNLMTYINRYFTRWVGAKVIADLRDEIFKNLVGQSLKFYGKMDVGHLISRCTNDTSAIETSVANIVADATRCPIEILSCVAAIVIFSMKLHNYSLLLVLLVGTPIVILPVAFLGRRIRKIYKGSFAKIAEVISRMHEVFTGILVVKASNTEELEVRRFHKVNRKYFRTIVHALKMQLLMSPMMEVIGVAATLVFLVYSYSRGYNFTALIAMLAPAILAYRPIKDLAKVVTYLQRSMAAADRYFDLIDTHTGIRERSGAVELEKFDKEISFNNVSFAYDDNDILKGVNFKIKKGQVVAVVGETGSGKTTIANLIARFYDVNSGSVTIDGTDVRDFKIDSLREHIGIVTQTPVLFNETIAHNIAYGCDDATQEQIVEAAKKANAHEFIVDGRHGEGYETEVGEKGFKLSGGEKQRVAIARAILKNPPVLILDEATSALDTVTERLVQEALNRAMENRTVFAIAHRLSTIQHADLIIVLKNGVITERGTHDELLKQEGIYRNLYETQFKTSETATADETGE
ncbi:ABC transporter ATP-binding protein [Lentisphaerota bacterium ZTH]|nr:ABC transporter ATP-binding protein [Lentisphaerota bacterium]WET07517.1 ABC transporter ATP-binding protein [Lentisphaerota bacterium ZTH]